MNDRLDSQCEGQMTIFDLFEPPERVVAVSRAFARARKAMTVYEWKCFVYALTELRFTEQAESNIVYLDRKILSEIVGVNSNYDHSHYDLNEKIKNLRDNSSLKFAREDKKRYINGGFINTVIIDGDVVIVDFNKFYLELFTDLLKDKEFLTLWTADIFRLSTVRSIQFYEYLRANTDSRLTINNTALGVRAFKEMFDIPVDAYMRKDGHFNRTEFEKRVIQPLCDDLSKTRMITLLLQPDGKYYEKVKAGNRVQGYRFYWTFSAYPAVASSMEVKELQDKVDSNPLILKVAKDIVAGSNQDRQQNKPTNNKFNNFTQRDYDFADLEKALIRRQMDSDSGETGHNPNA